MIGACSVEVQSYITDIVDESKRHNMTVYWGLKGFSVPAHTPDEKAHSIFYCFPPGANESPNAYIQGYMAPVIRETDIGEKLNDGFLAISGFKKAGQYTFRLDQTAETLDSAHQALKVVWKVASLISDQKYEKRRLSS